MEKLKVLTVIGTRPEAIKMAPLLIELSADKDFESILCVTGQHREMLDQVLRIFEIQPKFDLDIMSDGQDLTDITSIILVKLRKILLDLKPNIVLVHGDTTTALAATLAAFYQQIAVGHVEAGLRTGNLYSPWPEEANRRIIDSLAKFHFAPTISSSTNLESEGTSSAHIYITGNTVIDALFLAESRIRNDSEIRLELDEKFAFLDKSKKIILVTGHRRESFGEGFKRICRAIRVLSEKNSNIEIVYPVHLNPNVVQPVTQELRKQNNVHLIKPLEYLPFVYLMRKSFIILTDSGGIQEEAPSLGVPVLVMRETTERPEAVNAGSVKLVGTSVSKIVNETEKLLNDIAAYSKMAESLNPYGDGKASSRIVDILRAHTIEKPVAQNAKS
jgi:UDP-N-acetylglucosamine 2-epimerase (non-hydrolysing)